MSNQEPRKQFVNWLIKKARRDKRIWLLTGDLGFNFIEPFAKEFPDRFINCGIAEQNMIGVATGLKLLGWEPYVYSNAVFLNYKCIEQIRSAAFQRIKLNIVGTQANEFLGASHNLQKWEKEPLKLLKGINYIKL